MSETTIKSGKIICGFEIQKLLGQGNTGVVYQALQVNLNRPVALKILYKNIAEDEDFVRAFFREAQAAAAFTHPNIVQAYDVGISDDGLYYFAMEIIEGGDLEILLKEETKLEWQKALDIILPICIALEHGHRKRGLTHGDIKPANIMLDGANGVKLADLGLARMGEELEGESDAIMLTPLYAAPEMIRGEWKVGQAHADMYSLGATLFHVLCGHPPYEAPTYQEVLEMHKNTPIPDTRELITDAPEAVHELLNRLLAKNIEDRFSTWQEIVDFIQAINNPQLSSSSHEIQKPNKKAVPVVKIILLSIISFVCLFAYRSHIINREWRDLSRQIETLSLPRKLQELQLFESKYSLYNPWSKETSSLIDDTQSAITEGKNLSDYQSLMNSIDDALKVNDFNSIKLTQHLENMTESLQKLDLEIPAEIIDDNSYKSKVFAFHNYLKNNLLTKIDQKKRQEAALSRDLNGPNAESELNFYKSLQKLKTSLADFESDSHKIQRSIDALTKGNDKLNPYELFGKKALKESLATCEVIISQEESQRALLKESIVYKNRSYNFSNYKDGKITAQALMPYGTVEIKVSPLKDLAPKEILNIIENCLADQKQNTQQHIKLIPLYLISAQEFPKRLLENENILSSFESAKKILEQTDINIKILNFWMNRTTEQTSEEALLYMQKNMCPLAERFIRHINAKGNTK